MNDVWLLNLCLNGVRNVNLSMSNSFFLSTLNNWLVITMYGMFNGVKVFNTDISSWKTNSLNETQVRREQIYCFTSLLTSCTGYLN